MLVDDHPTLAGDGDRAPRGVTQINVNRARVPGETQVDGNLGTVEDGLALERGKGICDGLPVRCLFLGPIIESPRNKFAARGPERPGLPVACFLEAQIGAVAVVVKELCPRVANQPRNLRSSRWSCPRAST